MKNPVRGRASALTLPAALVLVGKAGPLLVAAPPPRHYRVVLPPTGALLVACPKGRELYAVIPRAPARSPRRRAAAERAALELRQRFSGRTAELRETEIEEPIGQGEHLGPLVLCCYERDRQLFEHYFEAPDQPALVAWGESFLHVQRGAWRLGPRGLEHHKGG